MAEPPIATAGQPGAQFDTDTDPAMRASRIAPAMTNPSTTITRQPVAQPITPRRSVPADLPEVEAPPTAKTLSKPAAYEARAGELAALDSQAVRLQATLAEALAARDRAIARKAVDGSNEARAAADAAVGAVVRVQAELDAVQSALARLETQRAENVAASARNKEVAQIKGAARIAEKMITLAGQADEALAAFLTAHAALGEKLSALHPAAPLQFHDGLFGGGNGLTQALLATAVKNQLAGAGIVPRAPYPNPTLATLSSAVTHWTKQLIDEAAGLAPAPIDWD